MVDISDEALRTAEIAAVEQLKTSDDFAVACTIYRLILDSLAKGNQPEAVCRGIEATIGAIRKASTEKQLQELSMPGIQ